MSNKKITDLTELTTPTTDDVFPVVDIATNTTQKVQLGNLPTTPAVTSALASKQATLVSGTNIKTVNGNSVLGSGDINIPLTPPSGVSGAIQFSTGSAFASDATNLFWDDTNNWLGIGTNSPSATGHFKGSGTTSATSSLIVANNAGTTALEVLDDSRVKLGNSSDFTVYSGVGVVARFAMNIGSTSLPTAQLQVKGSGTTSGTTSLLVQNSGGNSALTILDNLNSQFGGTVISDGGFRSIAYFDSFQRVSLNNGLNTNPQNHLVSGGVGRILLVDNSEGDFNRLQFGGTTSSYPSLKRNGTAIDVRLADDSNYAGFNTGATFIKGSGSTFATTSFLVQNSSASELLKIRDDGQIICGGAVQAVGVIGTAYGLFGSQSYDASVVLGSQSTSAGFLPPRMTTTQKNAIATPAAGLVVYDSTTNKLCCYNGSTWNDLF